MNVELLGVKLIKSDILHITITTGSFVFLYIPEISRYAMKSTQLLSVVFSLIMFTGVTAGNAAFAESDDLDDILEDFCELNVDPDAFFGDNPDLEEFRDEIILICELPTENEREDAIDEFIIDNFPEAIEEDDEVVDSYEDCIEAGGTISENLNECTFDDMVFVNDEDDDDDDVIDSFEDCVEAGNDVMESFPEKCMTEDGTIFVNDDDDDDDLDKVLVCHKNGKTLSIGADAQSAHLAHGDTEGPCDGDIRADFVHRDLDDLLDDYCELTDEKQIQLLDEHPRLAEFSDRLENYCDMSEDEQDAIDDLIEDYEDQIKSELRAYSDEYSNKGPGNFRDHMTMFCDMSIEEREAKIAENHSDLSDELRAELLSYCEMSEEEQDSFRDTMMDRMDIMGDHMKGKMTGKHMDYDRLCDMTASDRALEIDDSEKLDRISDWCEMSTEEREDYKKENHDEMKDKKEKYHEKMEKYSEKSDRLRAMIMDKRDISDERADEIKMKFEAKFGEDSDKKRSEIKMKYKDHMKHMKFKMSDERKSDVHERLAEMKAYKAELRANSSELSDEEKQQLREEFIEKAKDMQLAWISPRTQMTAGIDSAEVECREGFSLVMKASNGVAMCLKADTALKMIDRGIVVPAN